MYRPAVTFAALFLSWNCHAACDVTKSGSDTISLVVESGGCFRSDEQKQAFASQLKQAVQSMENSTSRLPQRKSTAEQLNGFGDLKRQARHLAPAPPVYYGQR
nr:hypothetical protein [uncultured Noviherbaspirillum sp.]